MQHHNCLGETARPGFGFRKRMAQRLGQFVVDWGDNARVGDRRVRRDERFAIVGLALEEACLSSRMEYAATERSVIDRPAVHEAGKVGADFLPLPVDFVSEEDAYRAELGFDGLVVELGGVQARHECRRAELMARKMNGNADDALGPVAPNERHDRCANAN
jgi:hypothetical protein